MPAADASPRSCPACSSTMEQRLETWLWYCPTCKLWTSDLQPSSASDDEHHHALDEDKRRVGIKPLRLNIFRVVLDALGEHMRLDGASLLEVGSAYGWFLEEAAKRGMRPVGVEPERAVAEESFAPGLEIRVGRFPDCVASSERFDVIAFNDVLEHLPDLAGILAACRERLTPRGKLIINLPASSGIIYRGACLAARVGWRPSLHRLWQNNFRFPHRYYFNADNLERLISRHGFRLLQSKPLPMLQLDGLWSRLRMDRTGTLLGAAAVWGAIVALYPLLLFAPTGDALLQIFERSDVP